MEHFKHILVATDTRLDDHPIVSEAAEISQQSGASLKIVDVVPEFSWFARLALKDHEQVRDLIIREKQAKLEMLAEPLRERGIDVETKVLQGKSSVEIIREVLRGQHDLVLRVAKGHDSRSSGMYGTTGVRLLRACPCAVWLTVPATTTQYRHVLGCIDTSTDEEIDEKLNEKIYKSATLVSDYHEASLSIIQAWSIFGERMLQSRLSPIEIQKIKNDCHNLAKSDLDQFLQKHGSSVREKNIHLVKGDASNVIPEFATKNGVDLVVMGTVARSGAAGLIIGNTAERILNSIECSVLALKPDSFVCPITLGDSINPARNRSEP